MKHDLVSNDNLPVEVTDPDIENNHFPSTNYPKVMEVRTSCSVVSKQKYLEKYSYNLIHLFFSFRDEMELKGKYFGT